MLSIFLTGGAYARYTPCMSTPLTDTHATGLCGDVLLDNICIVGYGLASQLLGKVVQTNYTTLTEIIHNTKNRNN